MRPAELDEMDPAVFYDYVARRGRYLQEQQDQREKAKRGPTQGDIIKAAQERGLKIY